jgi:hypothetical protein
LDGSAALASLFTEEGFAQSASITPGFRAQGQARHLSAAVAGRHTSICSISPELVKRNGEPIPESLIKGERFAFITGYPSLQKSPFEFKKYGKSGATLSHLLPGLASVVDDVTFIKSMYTTQFNHGPAQVFQMTGFQIPLRPSFGAWVLYGLAANQGSTLVRRYAVRRDCSRRWRGVLGVRLPAHCVPGHSVPEDRRPD